MDSCHRLERTRPHDESVPGWVVDFDDARPLPGTGSDHETASLGRPLRVTHHPGGAGGHVTLAARRFHHLDLAPPGFEVSLQIPSAECEKARVGAPGDRPAEVAISLRGRLGISFR